MSQAGYAGVFLFNRSALCYASVGSLQCLGPEGTGKNKLRSYEKGGAWKHAEFVRLQETGTG